MNTNKNFFLFSERRNLQGNTDCDNSDMSNSGESDEGEADCNQSTVGNFILR